MRRRLHGLWALGERPLLVTDARRDLRPGCVKTVKTAGEDGAMIAGDNDSFLLTEHDEQVSGQELDGTVLTAQYHWTLLHLRLL